MNDERSVEEIVERIGLWKAKDVTVSPLSGGLTNSNYLVETDGARYVVRIPGRSTELLAVARENEYTVEEVDLAIHAHPTLSEAIAEAALDSMGRVVHI